MKKGFIFLNLLIANCFASGDTHHQATISSLIFPYVNFIVLFGFIGIKLKNPLISFFNQKSKKISEILDRANVKSKEAQVLYDINNKKMSEIIGETNQIVKVAEEDAKKIEIESEHSFKEKQEKLRSEAMNRVEAERAGMISNLNKELINSVIGQTKQKIVNDKDLRTSLNNTMTGGLK